ncbi:hypothetical protein JCM11491_006800 [Sporobolomyces phaffii]
MTLTEPAYTPTTTVTDPLFLSGLASILGPYYARGATREEIQAVTDRAESFYLSSQAADTPSRVETDPAQGEASSVPSESDSSPPLPPLPPPPPLAATTTATATAADDPPYPLSFAHLAHLISTGAPIPGIKHVPDKLAEQVPSESTATIQRKPWERANVEAEEREHDRIRDDGDMDDDDA